MIVTLIFSAIISFIFTFLAVPYWTKRAKKAGLVGTDMNKYSKPKIAEIGGIAVVAGFLGGILAYIAIKTFYFKSADNLVQIFALISMILITTLIGLVDDILGWKIGLRQRQKPLLCLIAAIPLIVINIGQSTITLPLIGRINTGLFYPLLFVPAAIVGASNGFNMLAGYNGLEAGLGAIILSTIGIITFSSAPWVSLIAFCAVASLIAFLFFNKYPAKIFPGDTLTYPIGALIGGLAIVGNIERAAIILFLPFFVEFFLKLRGKMQKESFAKPQKDESLELQYRKSYSLTHIAINFLKKLKGKAYEKEVVFTILFLELIITFLVLFI